MTTKMTLLELTQAVLSSMDSDDVDSITDTVEAEQVTLIIRDVYNLKVTNSKVPEHFKLGVLTSPESSSYPNYFQYPTATKTIKFIKYDVKGSGDTCLLYTSPSPRDS